MTDKNVEFRNVCTESRRIEYTDSLLCRARRVTTRVSMNLVLIKMHDPVFAVWAMSSHSYKTREGMSVMLCVR